MATTFLGSAERLILLVYIPLALVSLVTAG